MAQCEPWKKSRRNTTEVKLVLGQTLNWRKKTDLASRYRKIREGGKGGEERGEERRGMIEIYKTKYRMVRGAI